MFQSHVFVAMVLTLECFLAVITYMISCTMSLHMNGEGICKQAMEFVWTTGSLYNVKDKGKEKSK